MAALSVGTIAFAAPAADAGKREAVPFELRGGHIFVNAYVNGQGPYRFGFDTGASGVGRADVTLTHALSLPVVDSAANSDGVRVSRADVVKVHRLRVGSLERRSVRLLSRDYHQKGRSAATRFMGIIGRDFFENRLLTIDYRTRQITFSRGHLNPDAPGVVRYSPGFAIPLCFAKACFPAKVDTGSSRGLVLPESVATKVASGAPVRLGTVSRTNSSAALYRVQFDMPMRVSGVALDGGQALFVKPSTDTINIGSDFLKHYVLTIDQRRHLLRISRPTVGG
ncbi:hypothetical protein FHR23_001968 [Stakelama sediminis]|uniref:Aspartyl protease n=1 Tax=Stakelama sediminis TaxID=463200 RepID=A0A840YZU5_9SPHN|nr:hypothetical protein [Stakelama sediminis]